MDGEVALILTIALDSHSTTLPESHDVDDENSYPACDNRPSGDHGENERNRCVHPIVSTSLVREIFVEIIHKVEDGSA